MNKKASVKTTLIIVSSLILIGLIFVFFGGKPALTSYSTYETECYDQLTMSHINMDKCCADIKKSTGCKKVENDKYSCGSLLVNKNTIIFCEG